MHRTAPGIPYRQYSSLMSRLSKELFLGTTPQKAVIDARKLKAVAAYSKLQQFWRSKLCWRAKVRISISSIVAVLLDGLDLLST